MARKIKVFLSGVVNSTNAQNLNCRALMKYLDPEKFEVRALAVYSGNLDLPDGTPRRVGRSRLANAFYSAPKAFYPVRYPAKIWHAIQLVRGILWSDVAYLCKPEHWKLQRFFCRLFGKRSFKTVEASLIGTNIDNALRAHGSQRETREFDSYTGSTYAISRWMRLANEKFCGLKTKPEPLYIGVDSRRFANDVVPARLTSVVMIGSNLFYKGIEDYFALANVCPNLTFHIVGSGLGKIDPAEEIRKRGLKNVIAHGSLSHEKLAELLKSVQLHVFPSKAEGFGKVTFETAAAGVPSVVYGCYGAREWIDSWHDGIVVDSFDEMVSAVQRLAGDSELLRALSSEARKLAEAWDWKNKIGPWARAIEDVFNGAPLRRRDAWLDVCEFLRKCAWMIVEVARRFCWTKYDYYRSVGSGDYSDPQFCRLTTWEAFREFVLARGGALYDWQIRRFEEVHASFVCLADKTSLWVGGWEMNDEGGRRLYDFVTVPEERRKGYYTRLLRHLRAEGDCYIYVRPSNEASVKAIRRAGFEKFDTRWERMP